MRDMTRRFKEVESGLQYRWCWVIFYIQYYNVAGQGLFLNNVIYFIPLSTIMFRIKEWRHKWL